jgi:hypothetical protein
MEGLRRVKFFKTTVRLADGKVKPEPEDLPIFCITFIKLSGERLEDLRL